MVLKSCARATLALVVALAAAGCGANPAGTLSDCILNGAEALATSNSETSTLECDLRVSGPYHVVLFPPKQVVDQPDTTVLASFKADKLTGPTHETIYVIPDDGDQGPWKRRNLVPASQLLGVSKSDPKLTVVLNKTAAGIEIAELR
jgi:hypothetical protein